METKVNKNKLKKSFKSLIEASKNFSDELVCRKYIEQWLWGNTPICPYCEHDRVYKFSDQKRYKCANNECYKIFNVTVGTFLEDTKIPLGKWLHAIYVFTSHKKGISSHQLAKDLDITQKSAWFLLSRLREVLKDKSPQILSNVVEIDEMYPQGKISNKKKHVRMNYDLKKGYYRKAPVVGILQRGGNCILAPFPDFKMGPVINLINTHVAPGSAVFTDSHYNYEGLGKNYFHKTINHGANEFKNMNIYTNSVEGLFSHAKRSLFGIYHQVSQKHIGKYCNEWAFRYNTRKMGEEERVKFALNRMRGRMTYDQLIGRIKMKPNKNVE